MIRGEKQLKDGIDDLMPHLSKLGAHTTPLTLLLDLSGSMRGYKILHSLISLCAISRLLEQAGQKFQVLGFTTKTWKGGEPRNTWFDQDQHPPSPGRLNALRHIVLKDFDMNWADAEPLVPVLFAEGVLKENIDGEALTWAADRQKNTGRLLLISDGTPADEATSDVMGKTYLESHFEEVIFNLIDHNMDIIRVIIGEDHLHVKGLPTVEVPSDSEALVFAQKLIKAIQDIS